MVGLSARLSRLLLIPAALSVFVAAAFADKNDVKPVEFTPLIDANGITIGWLGEQNAQEMDISIKERAFRLPMPGGGFTMFTVQAIPGDDTSLTGLQPISDKGPGRHHPGRDVDLRIEVKSGDPLTVIFPEGVRVTIPKDTVILAKYLVERLGRRGGALASSSSRDLFSRRLVTGFVRIETIVGGPVLGNDPGEGPRSIQFGEAVTFDVRNYYLPVLYSMWEIDAARMTTTAAHRHHEDDDDDGPVTP